MATLLLVLLPFMSLRSAATSDEGAYALQADALAHGSWAYQYRAGPLDPNGTAFPLVASARHGNHLYPYMQHPAYPEMLRGISGAVGSTLGLHLLALAGTVGTAVGAWLLAAEIDPRLRRWAFWLAALGPVLANGFLLWAHSLSAAVASLTLVAVLRAERRGATRFRTLATVAGVALGVLIRSEGLLFALALAVAVGAVRLRSSGPGLRRMRATAALGVTVTIAGPAVLAALAERAWVRHIAGGAYDNLQTRSDGTSWFAGRVSAVWHDLFEGPLATGRGVTVSLMVVTILVGLGLLARLWPERGPWALGGGALLATGITVAYLVVHPATPVPGLFALWPVALIGLIVVPWRRLGRTEVTIGACMVLFAAAVIATEYPAGGGVEWGGRFFSPILAPLAVLAVLGIDRCLATLPRDEMRGGMALLAVAVVAGGAVSIMSVAEGRARHAEMIVAVARHPVPVTVTTSGALPRLGWAANDRISWMLTDPSSLRGLLDGLRSRGVPEVAVVTDRVVPHSDLAGFGRVEETHEPALMARGLDLYVVHA